MSPLDRLEWLTAIVAFDGIRGGAAIRTATVLTKYCNKKTGIARPSIQTIANETGLTSRAVRTGLVELENTNFLAIMRSAGGVSSLTNEYRLIHKEGVNPATGVNSTSGVNHSSLTPELQFHEPLNSSSPEQGIEQGKNKGKEKPSVSPCPHSEIIQMYHTILPELPCIVRSRWHGSDRAKNLATRWKEDPRHQKIDFWETFFQTVRRNPHWMGENGRNWRADLGWLVKRSNFDKVIDRGVDEQHRSVMS